MAGDSLQRKKLFKISDKTISVDSEENFIDRICQEHMLAFLIASKSGSPLKELQVAMLDETKFDLIDALGDLLDAGDYERTGEVIRHVSSEYLCGNSRYLVIGVQYITRFHEFRIAPRDLRWASVYANAMAIYGQDNFLQDISQERAIENMRGTSLKLHLADN